jgi:putative addiction module CopG family antidote
MMALTAPIGQGKAMTIELKPEQERFIEEEIRSGHFRSPDEVLDHALAALREKDAKAEPTRNPRKQTLSEFLMNSPLAGSELDLERDRDPGRIIVEL